MAIEIERKFLVRSDAFKRDAFRETPIMQGYLSSVPERTVRVRIKGNSAFLTIKGGGSASGMSRYEWEHEIALEEAMELLKLCEPGAIEKTRFEVRVGNHIFEVDEFYGANHGLVIAEVELKSEDEEYDRPTWLGDEVTGDRRYYNSALLKVPFLSWKESL